MNLPKRSAGITKSVSGLPDAIGTMLKIVDSPTDRLSTLKQHSLLQVLTAHVTPQINLRIVRQATFDALGAGDKGIRILQATLEHYGYFYAYVQIPSPLIYTS